MKNTLGFFALLFAMGMLSAIASSCGETSSAPPELRQAIGLVEYFTTPSVLSRSTFPVVFPDGTPRQFVSWMFSGMGTAEWPPTKAEAMQEAGVERLPGMPVLPEGVTFRHTSPDTSKGIQMVVRWDDTRGVIIAEGYADPKRAPVITQEFSLPKVASTNELARLTAQSYLEMGGSPQAF